MMRQFFRISEMIIGHLLEKIRGPRVLEEVENNGVMMTVMTGVSIQGFTINITCTQSAKQCNYSRKWVRDRILYTYEVKVDFEGEPPEALRLALAQRQYFPDILIPWVSHAAQREAAISAFLDIIASKLPHYHKRHHVLN